VDEGPDEVADTDVFTSEKDVDAEADRDFVAVELGLLPSGLGELTATEDSVWVADLAVILCVKFEHPG
jgi:hypothetical protein